MNGLKARYQSVQAMLDGSPVPIDDGSKKAIDSGALVVKDVVLDQVASQNVGIKALADIGGPNVKIDKA
jgi:hypothetical protein